VKKSNIQENWLLSCSVPCRKWPCWQQAVPWVSGIG